MKLCEKVKEVLDVSVPNWMKRLCAVNFNIQRLDEAQQIAINTDQRSCFIGELHGGRGYENDNGDLCYVCNDLSVLIPYVFNTKHKWYIGKEHMLGYKVRLGIRDIGKTITDRKVLLEFIAKHVKMDHKRLMNKIQVENDC